MKAATQGNIMFVIGTLFCVAIGYGIGGVGYVQGDCKL